MKLENKDYIDKISELGNVIMGKNARKQYLKLVKYFHTDNKETGDE